MQIKITAKLVSFVLIGVGVIILLVSALIHYKVKAAQETARAEAILKQQEENQKNANKQVEEIKKSTQAQIDASNKVIESIVSAQKAQEVLLRNIPNAKPTIIQLPSAKQPVTQTSQLPNAPEPQLKKDNLLCYDEKGQIELAKFSEQCHQTSIALGGANATITEKDKIISSQGTEISTLKSIKTPGFWHKTWNVTKIAVPVGVAAWLFGRSQKGH